MVDFTGWAAVRGGEGRRSASVPTLGWLSCWLSSPYVEQLRASRLHQSTFFPTRGLPNPYWDDTVLSRWNRDNDSHNH
jgi:hypothetical protein